MDSSSIYLNALHQPWSFLDLILSPSSRFSTIIFCNPDGRSMEAEGANIKQANVGKYWKVCLLCPWNVHLRPWGRVIKAFRNSYFLLEGGLISYLRFATGLAIESPLMPKIILFLQSGSWSQATNGKFLVSTSKAWNLSLHFK